MNKKSLFKSKATRKLNRSINKSLRKSTKQQKKEVTKRKRALKYQEKINTRLAEIEVKLKAIDSQHPNVEVDMKEFERLKSDITRTVQNITTKYRITDRDFEVLKERASKKFYDRLVHVDVDVPDDRGDVVVPVPKKYKLADLEKLVRKQLRDPNSLTEEETTAVLNYADSRKLVANAVAPDVDEFANKSTDELKKSRRFKAAHDPSLGGTSTLINDLLYTYTAIPTGRAFVQMLQRLMSDPQVFVRVEMWYRSNDRDARDTKELIDQARGGEWYGKFLSFSRIIIKVCNSIANNFPSLSDKFTEIKARAEEEGDLFEG